MMQPKFQKLSLQAKIVMLSGFLTISACSSSDDNPAAPLSDDPGVATDGATTVGATTDGTTTVGATTDGTTTDGTTTVGATTDGTTTDGTTTVGATTDGTTTVGTTTVGATTDGTTTVGATTVGATTVGATTDGTTTVGATTDGTTTDGTTTVGATTDGTTTDGATTDGGEPTGPTVDLFLEALEVPETVAPADGTPSVPRNLRVDILSNNWVELNWAASADNGEIVEYRLYRNDGVIYSIRGDQTDVNPGSLAEIQKYWQTTSFIDCNFTRFLDRVHNCGTNTPAPGAEFFYTISAIDNDGNESAQSQPLRVKFYEKTGSPVEPYTDPYLDGNDTFPFTTDFSSPDNFLDRFQLVFADEFNGESIDPTKWNTVLTWGHNETINGEKQYFVDTQADPDFGYNPFVMTGSELSIQAIETPAELSEAALGQPFLSGALSSHDKFGFNYGYIEGRMKVGGVSGQLSSFYLFRRWDVQNSPEIDIVEYLGENPFGDEDAFQTYHFKDTVHDVTRSSPTMFEKSPGGKFSDDYHTYSVLWEPGLVIWYIDGQEIKRLSGRQIARQDMNIVLYQVTGSDWAPFPDTSPGNLPLKFDIDYIRVYQRDPYIRSN